MSSPSDLALEAFRVSFGGDSSTRLLHVQTLHAGDPLIPVATNAIDATPRISNTVTVVKFFVRTTGPAPETPSRTSGTDVGMEIWLPDPVAWNNRIRVQIQGGFMGDAAVTSKHHFSAPICSDLQSGQMASDTGYVVSTTDGGHVADTYEDTSYLMDSEGNTNREGWKNVAWQATHLLGQKTKELSTSFYGRSAKYTYLYGCSTGGRAAYHSAQKFPGDFDGLLVGCPSITQSLLFPSLVHPHIVIANDLAGEGFKPGQLEMVSRKAIAAGDETITGQHDGYITDWASNTYDPTKDPSVISVAEGGHCTAPWALSMAQAHAINKIWYGPTLDGSIPDPVVDNGTKPDRPPGQIWWGKIRGTRIDFSAKPRDIAGGMFALAHKDVSLASPLWQHPLGKSENRWKSFSHSDFAKAMLKNQELDQEFENMDADDPDLRSIQQQGKKIMVYHGLADVGVAPQSAINYYLRSTKFTGGLEKTQDFHRLFLIPGMGHCVRYRGCAGVINPPIPSLEEMFESLTMWVEKGVAPDYLLGTSADGQVSRPICPYPKKPRYVGGDANCATSFDYS